MAESVDELLERIERLEREKETLQRNLDEAMSRERDLLAIVDNAPAPIYLKDAGFRYLHVNKQYERLAHVTSDVLQGKTDFDIFPPAVAELFRSQDEEVIGAGHAIEFEETIPLPDGDFAFITVKFPVTRSDGTLRAVGGFCADITARKEVERDRQRLLEELQTTLNEVATLRKILPICSRCRRIRDDDGAWSEIEAYLQSNAELEFSHSMCPACTKKLYGDQPWYRGVGK